jgi:hypothetical protein
MSLAIISKQENVCGKDSPCLISLLFHIMVDVLVILIVRPKEDGEVGGLITLLAVNMKLILFIFENLSGLKMNFHKSFLQRQKS